MFFPFSASHAIIRPELFSQERATSQFWFYLQANNDGAVKISIYGVPFRGAIHDPLHG